MEETQSDEPNSLIMVGHLVSYRMCMMSPYENHQFISSLDIHPHARVFCPYCYWRHMPRNDCLLQHCQQVFLPSNNLEQSSRSQLHAKESKWYGYEYRCYPCDNNSQFLGGVFSARQVHGRVQPQGRHAECSAQRFHQRVVLRQPSLRRPHRNVDCGSCNRCHVETR